MNNILSGITLLLLWLMLCAFVYHHWCCKPNMLLIKDGDHILINSHNNIDCTQSSSQVSLNEALKGEYKSVVSYLSKHPRKILNLIGFHAPSEDYAPNTATLGLERAENLKSKLVELGVNEVQIATSAAKNIDLAFADEKCRGCVGHDIINRHMTISDGDGLSIEVDDNLSFDHSTFKHHQPVSMELEEAIAKAATYLKENPNRKLTITGAYADQEDNRSLVPDLGLARANDVKALLLGLDVPAGQLFTKGMLNDSLTFYNNVLIDGINFDFDESLEVGTNLAKPDKSITLYFQTGEDEVTLDAEQRVFFAEVINYLDNNPESQILITGHTDNQGRSADNVELSRSRAEFVKNYLSNNGLRSSQISIKARGPYRPQASNRTAEGRAKNRRVEIELI